MLLRRFCKFTQNRKEKLSKFEYPHEFKSSMQVKEFIEKYKDTVDMKDEPVVKLAGRIESKRVFGNKLYFYTIQSKDSKIQVMSTLQHFGNEEGYYKIHEVLKRGDLIGVVGNPGRSKKGELSILPKDIQLLAPCLHDIPLKYDGLENMETRYRKRYLDLMMNEQSRKIFKKRDQVIRYLRKYLQDKEFLEVETPMMNLIPGGAAAKPFSTYHHDMNRDVFMRISPELYLKQCVIGGLDRVFEIGRQFRNESIDLTHNPEFTTCEFYMAYADYNDVLEMTEDFISKIVYDMTGSYDLMVKKNGQQYTINCKPPFQRVSMIDTIQEATGVEIPLHDAKLCHQLLEELVQKHNLDCPLPRTSPRLLDRLVDHFIVDNTTYWNKPLFIVDYPTMTSPLAKQHRSKPHLTERFELFFTNAEICNAYTELNDPSEQEARFQDQQAQRKEGDKEAQQYDEQYCKALEYGLPPTAGWGLGVDRLTMFLTSETNIKEVILFPAMRPVTKESKAVPKSIDFAQLDAQLGSQLFFNGFQPSPIDAKYFTNISQNAQLQLELQEHANLDRWYNLVSLFPLHLRRRWR